MRVLLVLVLLAAPASAATIRVGPGRALTQLSAVTQNTVNPGDVIEVDGNATYQPVRWTRSGTAAMPIRIVGLRVNGQRPRLMGGTNTLEVEADHVVVEGFELTGGSFRCFYHHGDDLTLRDSVVHDCAAHGVLGADQGSGSLLMEFVEVYRCGNGTSQHQVYLATDEVAHPGSVFRMRYCYLHDALGGNNVKSRAERNELHYNWIEGAMYHELELIGPDPNGAAAGWTIDTAREDSEVVGNVLRKTATTFVARIGGDATGWSKGRYRFVNNTIIVQPGGSAVFRLFDELESVEMHNNVIAVAGAGTANVMRAVAGEMSWVGGTRRVSGSNNWVQMGASNVPMEWTNTRTGSDPGFTMPAGFDYRPLMGSPLVNQGTTAFPSPGVTFPSPLAAPGGHPPLRQLMPGSAEVRPVVGVLDIGAYEFGMAMGGGAGGGSAGGSAAGGSAAGGSAAGGSAGGSAAGGSAGGSAAGGSGGGSAAGGSAGGSAAGGSAAGGSTAGGSAAGGRAAGGSAAGGGAAGGSAAGGSAAGGSAAGGSAAGGSAAGGSAAGGNAGGTTGPAGCGCSAGPMPLVGLALLVLRQRFTRRRGASLAHPAGSASSTAHLPRV
ncbi:MAG: hypothetical protein JNJ54_20355 [Myxococcaceae bacterium]|nr:hypothetical protein [Myxococcaceae bacterium]